MAQTNIAVENFIVVADSECMRGYLLDEEYRILGQSEDKPIDLSGEVEGRARKAWEAIEAKLNDLCMPRGLQRDNLSRLHLLIKGAGFGPGKFKRQLYDILREKGLCEKTLIQSPEEAMLHAVVGPAPGIFVRCDVNTLVFGKGEGPRCEVALGWGTPIAGSDYCSASQIGLKAVAHVLQSLMKTDPPTEFEKAILQRCQAGGLQQFRDWAQKNKSDLNKMAALSEVVHEWAVKPGKQSPIAKTILSQEIGKLVAVIKSLQAHLDIKNLILCISGSSFRYEKSFRLIFHEKLGSEPKVYETKEPFDASIALLGLSQNRSWGPNIVLPPMHNVVEAPGVEVSISEGECLALGIYGATSRTGAVIGRRNGEALYTIKGDLTLAYQAVPDVRALQLVFDDMFRRIHNYASSLMSQVRYVQVCASGAGGTEGAKAYKAAVKDSMKRYFADVDDLSIEVGPDALAVLASNLLTPGKKFSDQGGIAVLSGTGSIIYQIMPGGVIDRQGGYGAPFTFDPGSSYDVGFHLLNWLHKAVDIGDWKPLGATDWMPSSPAIDPYIEKFLTDILSYFVKAAIPWTELGKEGDPDAPFHKKRDALRYLPLKCTKDSHHMKRVVAGINRLACSLCDEDQTFRPLEKIKLDAAARLVEQLQCLIVRQRDNIENYMDTQSVEQYPIILEGGSFLCPVFSNAVLNGIHQIQKTCCDRVFDIHAPRFEPALGAFAMACEQRDNTLYDPNNTIQSGNKPSMKLIPADFFDRAREACPDRSQESKRPPTNF